MDLQAAGNECVDSPGNSRYRLSEDRSRLSQLTCVSCATGAASWTVELRWVIRRRMFKWFMLRIALRRSTTFNANTKKLMTW